MIFKGGQSYQDSLKETTVKKKPKYKKDNF